MVTVVKTSKVYLTIAITAVVIVCTMMTAYALGNYLKFVGIPISSDNEVSSESLPPNVKQINAYQAGQYTMKVMRVKVVSVDSVVSGNNQIVGFDVKLQVKSPERITVKIVLKVGLYGGNEVSVTKNVDVDPGLSTVYVELSQPVNPDDIVSLYVDAEPT